MSRRRDINCVFLGRHGRGVRKSASAIARIALMVGSLVIASYSPSFADAEACGELRMRLSDQISDQDCSRERRRGGGYDGTAWIETIKSANADLYFYVRSVRAATSRSYMRSRDIKQIFEDYDLGPDMRMVGEPKRAMNGVEFVTIRGDSICMLFSKQAMPRSGGYAFRATGIVCEHDKRGLYREEDANRLVSQIEFEVQ